MLDRAELLLALAEDRAQLVALNNRFIIDTAKSRLAASERWLSRGLPWVLLSVCVCLFCDADIPAVICYLSALWALLESLIFRRSYLCAISQARASDAKMAFVVAGYAARRDQLKFHAEQ